jgi:type VI secretion system secreted protein Hcp
LINNFFNQNQFKMKKCFLLPVLLLCASFFFQVNAQDIFLKAMAPPGGDYGGLIKGGSNQQSHQNEIEVLSYSNGMSSCLPNFNGGAGGQACKPSVGSVFVMMPMTQGVDQLRYFLLTGVKLPTADFSFVKTGGDGVGFTYYKIHMEDIVVVSVQESASAGGGTPMVSVEFAASRIAWANYTQNQGGNTTLASKVGYNIATNSIWNYAF